MFEWRFPVLHLWCLWKYARTDVNGWVYSRNYWCSSETDFPHWNDIAPVFLESHLASPGAFIYSLTFCFIVIFICKILRTQFYLHIFMFIFLTFALQMISVTRRTRYYKQQSCHKLTAFGSFVWKVLEKERR